MATVDKYGYGTLRLNQEVIDLLKDMKSAFEVSYQKKFTMSKFLEQMTASVEDGDPAVWEIYCTMRIQKAELKQKVKESRALHKKS